MPKSTFTSKGQVTIPKEPEAGGLLGNLPGLLHPLTGERPITVEEMNEGIRERMREKFGPRAQR